MKRIYILVVMSFVAISSFGYYGSYSYNEPPVSPAEVILFIILIVFGILQIILFFKLWGMTNNVRKIKKYLVGDYEDITDFNYRKLAFIGDTKELKEKMIYDFMYSIKQAYNKLPLDRSFVENGHYKRLETDKSIAQYKEILRCQLERIGEPFPEMIAKIETFDDYMKSYDNINFLKEYEELDNPEKE